MIALLPQVPFGSAAAGGEEVSTPELGLNFKDAGGAGEGVCMVGDILTCGDILTDLGSVQIRKIR